MILALVRLAISAALLTVALNTMAQSSPPQAEILVVVHRKVSSKCELIESGRLLKYARYFGLVVSGSSNEVYSPELGSAGYITLSSDVPSEVQKDLGKSGFKIRSKDVPPEIPTVKAKGSNASCPAIEQARSLVEQQRQAMRKQLQLKVHTFREPGMTPPTSVSSPRPKPPDDYQKTPALLKGKTVLEIGVGADGKVIQTKVVRSFKPELDRKAVEAVEEWLFDPARKYGLPVPVSLNVEVDFKLY